MWDAHCSSLCWDTQIISLPLSPFGLGLIGCVGDCFQSTHWTRGMLGVLSHMECAPLIQAGDRHFPSISLQGSRHMWRHQPSLCNNGKALAAAAGGMESTGESRVCPVGRNSLAQPGQQGFVASRAPRLSHCCSREARHRTGCQDWALAGSSHGISRGNCTWGDLSHEEAGCVHTCR